MNYLRYEQVLQQVLDKKVSISHIDMASIERNMNVWDVYFDCLQIREISRDAGVYTDQELRAILKFYHSFGKITFFGEK